MKNDKVRSSFNDKRKTNNILIKRKNDDNTYNKTQNIKKRSDQSSHFNRMYYNYASNVDKLSNLDGKSIFKKEIDTISADD